MRETLIAGAIDIPLLRVLETERETGGVAVEVLGAGEIKETKPQGLEAAEAADLGPMVAGRQSPSLAAFRFRATAHARSLNVQVARYAQQAVLTANIEEARYRVPLRPPPGCRRGDQADLQLSQPVEILTAPARPRKASGALRNPSRR